MRSFPKLPNCKISKGEQYMPTIQVLGCLAGTEPFEGRHHTSVVVTQNNTHYFLDAGENCSRLAHLGGVNLLRTRAIFLSHTHYDHIGGLSGLFWNIRKLCTLKKGGHTDFQEIPLLIPDPEAWEGVRTLLSYTEDGYFGDLTFSILPQKPKEGLCYEDENLKVYAFPSSHLQRRPDGDARSFSYRIEFPGYSMVYSGDLGSVEDLAVPVGDGCDLLMVETGHHAVKTVCDFADANKVGELLFYHHGREILYGKPSVEEALAACKTKVALSHDGMILER